MKKLAILFLLVPALCFGAAQDFIGIQRNAANTQNAERRISPAANSLLGFSADKTLVNVTAGTGIEISGNVISSAGGVGTGDVVGPASAADGELVLFSGTGGKTVKRSNIVPSANVLTLLGAANYAAFRSSLSAAASGANSDITSLSMATGGSALPVAVFGFLEPAQGDDPMLVAGYNIAPGTSATKVDADEPQILSRWEGLVNSVGENLMEFNDDYTSANDSKYYRLRLSQIHRGTSAIETWFQASIFHFRSQSTDSFYTSDDYALLNSAGFYVPNGYIKTDSTLISTASAGLSLTASSAGVEMGAVGSTNTPFIDFHSSSSSTDYDVRLIASGGTGSSGGGTLTITADTVGLSASPAANDSDLSVATTAYVQGELTAYASDSVTFTNKSISGSTNTITNVAISTAVSGLGTNVATALAVNVGSAGAFVVNGGALGTPSSGTLTFATGLPISTGVSGLGSGVAAWLATSSSANLATAVTGETGTGGLVFADTPTLITPNIGAATGASVNLSGGGTFGGTIVSTSSSGLSLTASSAGMELGAVGSTNTPFIDFHSSSSSTDYDVRFLVSGGTGSSGGGTLTITADTVGLSASPAAGDNDLSVATTAFVQAATKAPPLEITGTTLTLTRSTHNGKMLWFSNASGCVVTVNGAEFQAGDDVFFHNAAAGEVSFTAGSGGITISLGTYTIEQNFTAGIYFISGTAAFNFGALSAP